MSVSSTVPEALDGRILIVDDEPVNVMVLTQMLERAGYRQVLGVTESPVALTQAEAFEPDLVLLDLHMPPPDGYAILDVLAQRSAETDDFVPVVVVTADVTEAAKQRALSAGAHDFITKPYSYTELALRVRNLLRARVQHVALRRHNSTLRHQIEQAEAEERARMEEKRSLSLEIERMLEGPGLEMVFQPIIDLFDARVEGVEALARFAAIPYRTPDQWFASAAEVGLGNALEISAISRAIDQIDDLPMGAYLALNASPAAIRSPFLLRQIERVDPARLVLELTEHERIDDYRAVNEPIARLRELGLRLAVDDAGAGFASLEHILRLRPDIIKLDRKLISGVDDGPAQRTLIRALVGFCEEVGAQLQAEGIETRPELEVLRDLGVRYGQGFLLGEPGPPPLRTPVASELWPQPV